MGSKGTIAILTGGGDVPGLNPAIRAITIRALREGYRVIGIRRGWAHRQPHERVDADGRRFLRRDAARRPRQDLARHFALRAHRPAARAARSCTPHARGPVTCPRRACPLT